MRPAMRKHAGRRTEQGCGANYHIAAGWPARRYAMMAALRFIVIAAIVILVAFLLSRSHERPHCDPGSIAGMSTDCGGGE
jgi:hypothetical protein